MGREDLQGYENQFTAEELAAINDDTPDEDRVLLDDVGAENLISGDQELVDDKPAAEEKPAEPEEKAEPKADEKAEEKTDAKAEEKPAEEKTADDKPAEAAKVEDEKAIDPDTVFDTIEAADPTLDQSGVNEKLATIHGNVESLEDQRDKLAEDHDEGELTSAEYRKRDRELSKQIDDLKTQDIQLRTSFANNVESSNREFYNKTVPSFMNDHPEYKTGLKREVLNSVLISLQDKAVEKGRNPQSRTLLDLAHHMVSKEFGVATATPTKETEQKTATTPDGKREIPPTLSHVQGGNDDANISDNPVFAQLDQLTGKKLEDAMMELGQKDPDMLAKYMEQ